MAKVISTYELNSKIGEKAAEDEEFRLGLLSVPRGRWRRHRMLSFLTI